MSKTLVAFYSRAGENYFGGNMKMLEVGNTEVAAKMIKDLTDADIFKIQQMNEYDIGYDKCVQQAKEDKNANIRPALKEKLASVADYDVIYLGYPNYWGTMPMAVFTFLESLDFAGKTIKPFCTHEGSGMGSSEADIERLCPTAKVASGLAIKGSKVNSARENIEKWL